MASSSSTSNSTTSRSPQKVQPHGNRKIIKKKEPVGIQSGSSQGRSTIPVMSKLIGENPLDLQQLERNDRKSGIREREKVTLHQPVVAKQQQVFQVPTSPQSPTPSGGSQGDLYPLFLEFMHSLEGRREVGMGGGHQSSAASSSSVQSHQSGHRVPIRYSDIQHQNTSSSTRRSGVPGQSIRSGVGTSNSSLYPDYFNRLNSYQGPATVTTFPAGKGSGNLKQVKRDSKTRLQELRKSHIRDRDHMVKRMPSAERRRKDRERIKGTLTPSSSQSTPTTGSGKGRVGRVRNPSVEIRKVATRSTSRDCPQRSRISVSPAVRVGRTVSVDRQLGRSNSTRSNTSVGCPRPAWRPGGSPSPSPLVARRTSSPLLKKDGNVSNLSNNKNKGIRTRSPGTVVRIGSSAPKRLLVTPRDSSAGPKSRKWL